MLALSASSVVGLVILFVFMESLPVLNSSTPSFFNPNEPWFPLEGKRGLLSMVAASVLCALGAIAIALPLGIASAFFAQYYGHSALVTPYRWLLGLLAGIPSVVFGFWGLTVLVPLAAPSTGGLARWAEFAHNSFIDTVPSANNIGLKGLLAHRERDKWAMLKGLPGSVERWETARAEALEDRWLVRAVGISAGVLLLALAPLRRPDEDWVFATFGIAIVPIAFHLASYYHVSIAVLGLLATRQPWIGVALCGLAAYSQWLGTLAIEPDERYVWLTAGWLVFVVFTACAWLTGRPPGSEQPVR